MFLVEEYGAHSIDIEIDGRLEKSVPFIVIEPPA